MVAKEQVLIMIAHFLIRIVAVIICSSIHGIESLQYKVMHSESESGIEVRLYKESTWVSSPVRGGTGTSFQKSTKDGFHRIYQYIHGGNLNSSQLPITVPVLTTIVQAAAILHPSDYFVKLNLPEKLQTTPPQPNPELNLHVEKWGAQCIAIKKFSGFAKDDNINEEAKALIIRLNEVLNVKIDVTQFKHPYTIAQYDPPFHVSGRLNEVWINVSALSVLAAKDCASSYRY